MNDDSKKRRSFSIQRKLLVYLLIISLIPLLVMGLFSIYMSSKPLQQVAMTPLKNHVLSISSHIRQELYNVREDALYASRLPDLSRFVEYYDESSQSEQIRLLQDVVNDFQELITKRKKYHYISYINSHGHEVVRLNYSSGDPANVVLGEQLQNKSDKVFFKKTEELDFGEVYVSTVTLNEENGILDTPYTRVLYIATPVENIMRDKKGIIVIALRAEVLFKPVREWKMQEYPNAVSFITNQVGFYLAHSDSTKEWGTRQDLEMEWSLINDYPTEVSNPLLHDSEMTIIDVPQTDEIFVKIMSYPEFMNNKSFWVIVSSVPRSVVYARVNRFKQVLLGILLITALCTFCFAMMLSRQFTRPIKNLRNGASIISNGDLSHRIEVVSNDEIGDLTRDFNSMTAQLEELYQNLEQKVKERTERLQKALEDLRTKDKLLDESDRLKLDFLTNLSSELRTPLTSVTNYIALLSSEVYGNLADKQKDALKKAQRNLYHTFKWLDGIIRISSLSALKPDQIGALNCDTFNLVDIIISVLKTLQYALDEQRISVTFANFSETHPYLIVADKEKVDEIMASILNAIIHHNLCKNSSLTLTCKERIENKIQQYGLDAVVEFPDSVEDMDVDDFYRALKEPFIHSHSYFNITNLSTNVARGLVTLLGGEVIIKRISGSHTVTVTVYFKKGERA
ncbi:MAG: HAMP domain-containing protein [Candidatus Auribacter fodinae]|jgi:signal transduction histidine kinase|uniref:histidine kinase n=1 Tax=Candidatus Auribacter fodinae TaxID=2093366 RepID=A0A3A4QZ85_9BACT|nr:MAG: HAMP domain-containing protein [Candidatus Auribacter fodinae]